jgi:hypothetical protein
MQSGEISFLEMLSSLQSFSMNDELATFSV